jgi:tetratricopeptide (TPR) repeat protein
LTMEVAYQEVGELRHRLLHRRVASALESIHHNQLDEMAGLIAQHYAEGDQIELAAKYARRAGQRAVRLAAWKSAAAFFRQALAATPAAEQPDLLVALGNAQLHSGELLAAEETLRQALQLDAIQRQGKILNDAIKGLGEALILQARYRAVMDLAQSYVDHPSPSIRSIAQFMWGASLSLEGSNLDEARLHLMASQTELQGTSDMLAAQVEFELGNIEAQQDRLEFAIEHYKNSLALSSVAQNSATQNFVTQNNQNEIDEALRSQVLAHNNLAYHYHLMGDPRANEHIQQGLALAGEKGMLLALAYLYSTAGEIALAQEEFTSAESAFNQALAHAQRLNQPERIAGVTANMGRLAQSRGQIELATHRFTTALAQADAISSRFLAAQIRLWLAPLVPRATAHTYLSEARTIIATGRYHRLVPPLERLENALASR